MNITSWLPALLGLPVLPKWAKKERKEQKEEFGFINRKLWIPVLSQPQRTAFFSQSP